VDCDTGLFALTTLADVDLAVGVVVLVFIVALVWMISKANAWNRKPEGTFRRRG
jgi:hypothetical protein